MGFADKGTAQNNKILHVLEIHFARKYMPLKKYGNREFPGALWPRFSAPNPGSLGFIPGQGIRSHMLE